MRRTLVVVAAIVLLSPLAGYAQDARATLESASKALGADSLKSLQFSGTGVSFARGRARCRGRPGPASTSPPSRA